MAVWKPASDAPPPDKLVEVKTKGGATFIASLGLGYVDVDENDCCGWAAYREWEAPKCWTDGVCWEQNEDGVPSDPVVAWRLR